jgi:hypothetical protein
VHTAGERNKRARRRPRPSREVLSRVTWDQLDPHKELDTCINQSLGQIGSADIIAGITAAVVTGEITGNLCLSQGLIASPAQGKTTRSVESQLGTTTTLERPYSLRAMSSASVS